MKQVASNDSYILPTIFTAIGKLSDSQQLQLQKSTAGFPGSGSFSGAVGSGSGSGALAGAKHQGMSWLS